jgi:hypothetical protein
MTGPPEDPKNLVHEAYRIVGIGEAECRSILVDWALSLEMAPEAAARRLLMRHCERAHPMTALLGHAARGAATPRRRGGRRRRLGLTGQPGPEGERGT